MGRLGYASSQANGAEGLSSGAHGVVDLRPGTAAEAGRRSLPGFEWRLSDRCLEGGERVTEQFGDGDRADAGRVFMGGDL